MTRIENEMQYNSAMARINELLKVVNDNTPENDFRRVELVTLSHLVADFEDEHYPIEFASMGPHYEGYIQDSIARGKHNNPSEVNIAASCAAIDEGDASPDIVDFDQEVFIREMKNGWM